MDQHWNVKKITCLDTWIQIQLGAHITIMDHNGMKKS